VAVISQDYGRELVAMSNSNYDVKKNVSLWRGELVRPSLGEKVS